MYKMNPELRSTLEYAVSTRFGHSQAEIDQSISQVPDGTPLRLFNETEYDGEDLWGSPRLNVESMVEYFNLWHLAKLEV